MILLNFSHPLTEAHLRQVEAQTGRSVERVIPVPVQIEADQPMLVQAARIADRAGLSATEWQTEPLVVHLPGYAPAAAALLAEMHARSGYFVSILWMQRAEGAGPPQFGVGEVVDLDEIRDSGRERRIANEAPPE